MLVEFTKLTVGLLIAMFHRQISDCILEQEMVFVTMLRQRGLNFPALSSDFSRSVYFSLGIFVAAYEMLRIWALMHPNSALSPIATFGLN